MKNLVLLLVIALIALSGCIQPPVPKCNQDSQCDDANPCTIDVCSENQCQHTKAPDGTKCLNGICNNGICKTYDNLEIKPLIDGHNKLNADRINLVFFLIDFPNELNAKNFVLENVGFDDGKIIQKRPPYDYEKNSEIIHVPEGISLLYTVFFIEPYKSNKDKFNLWYAIVDLDNNEEKYWDFFNKQVSEPLEENKSYFPSLKLSFIHPIIIRAFPKDNYTFMRQSALPASFYGLKEKELDKKDLRFGYFFDYVGIDDNGTVKATSSGLTSLIWAHELGHSLFGLMDEYFEAVIGGHATPRYGYPNCAESFDEAVNWWDGKVGKVDSSYYSIIEENDGFYQENKKPDNIVFVSPLSCSETDLNIGFFKGGCFGGPDANVFRPSKDSLMNQTTSCPVLGTVNRDRAEQVLDLFSGK